MHDGFTRTAKIVGLGAYLPDRVLTNHDLEKIVDTSDDWIFSRTGISERRMVADGEALVDLVERAGRAALSDAAVTPEEVDLLILATATVDQPIPASSAIVQPRLGLENAACFDLSAACSGFTYGLNVARQFIATGEAGTALVIGAECLTRYVDWTDRTTCVLFGDGAAGRRDSPDRVADRRLVRRSHRHARRWLPIPAVERRVDRAGFTVHQDAGERDLQGGGTVADRAQPGGARQGGSDDR